MSAFDSFVARLHAHLTTDPNACVEKGVPAHLGELPDPSVSRADAQASEARALLSDLSGLELGAATFDENLDAELARLLLSTELHRLTHHLAGSRALCRTPTAGKDIGDGIFLLLAQDPRPAPERIADVQARIHMIPDYVDALLGRLEEPVRRWVRLDLDRVRGLPTLFASVRALAGAHGVAGPGLDESIAAATRSLERYEQRLAAMSTTTHFALGTPLAERVVALRGIEQPLATLHRWAREFLAENAAAVEDLRGRLTRTLGLSPGTTAADLHHELNRRYRLCVANGDFRVVLARYEEELERIVAFIRERGLFPIPEGQRVLVLETPPFMVPSIPAGAMMSPPPFRSGERRSLVYLTLSDALLDEHTEISIPSMMIHEAIPGHHLQLSEAARHPSVVRRHFDAMDQAEGWTTMLEDYMLDVGYLADHADELRFVGKREIARIGARVAIDLFFMTGERTYLDVGIPCDLDATDPFEAAGSLLGAVTGFVPERIDAELGWYSLERGYPLCYLTGNRLVWELRREVAAHLGEGAATDRRFHDEFLAAGSMPVAMLRRVMRHRGLLPAE